MRIYIQKDRPFQDGPYDNLNNSNYFAITRAISRTLFE